MLCVLDRCALPLLSLALLLVCETDASDSVAIVRALLTTPMLSHATTPVCDALASDSVALCAVCDALARLSVLSLFDCVAAARDSVELLVLLFGEPSDSVVCAAVACALARLSVALTLAALLTGVVVTLVLSATSLRNQPAAVSSAPKKLRASKAEEKNTTAYAARCVGAS